MLMRLDSKQLDILRWALKDSRIIYTRAEDAVKLVALQKLIDKARSAYGFNGGVDKWSAGRWPLSPESFSTVDVPP